MSDIEPARRAVPAKPDLEQHLAEVRDRTRAQLAQFADKAVMAILELVEMGESEQVRLAAATKLLALVGVNEVKETKNTNVNVDGTVDKDIAETLQRLQKNKQAATPAVIDVGEIQHVQLEEGKTDE